MTRAPRAAWRMTWRFRFVGAAAQDAGGVARDFWMGISAELFDPAAVEAATADWVQWFNTERIHSSIDDLTPIELEQLEYALTEPLEQAG